jgi:hypothetical protein
MCRCIVSQMCHVVSNNLSSSNWMVEEQHSNRMIAAGCIPLCGTHSSSMMLDKGLGMSTTAHPPCTALFCVMMCASFCACALLAASSVACVARRELFSELIMTCAVVCRVWPPLRVPLPGVHSRTSNVLQLSAQLKGGLFSLCHASHARPCAFGAYACGLRLNL